ncbi:hypothetical protein, partial [Mycetohabitans sp. B6]|uniref:hypothetical protein n=1 Tax=Mycetohabitans sp. B6 TaxID=2841843 RepID=UPI001F2748A5
MPPHRSASHDASSDVLKLFDTREWPAATPLVVAQFAAAYRQARALTAEARASGFPTLSGSASGSRAGS